MNQEEVSTDENKINWVTIEEAEALQKKQKRPIYIDVYTTWCGPCKLMSSKTFTNKKVIEIMNNKFYAVKFDAESKKALKFNGQEYSSPGRNHSFTSYLQVRAFPTSAFIDSDLNTITSVAGYFTPKEFIPMLDYIGNDHYKSKSWEEFTK
jgi:thioredoxin-related protein